MSVPFKKKGLEHSNNINFDSFTVVNFDLYFEYYKRPLSYKSKILRYCMNLNLCRLSGKHSVTMLSVIIIILPPINNSVLRNELPCVVNDVCSFACKNSLDVFVSFTKSK